jgi:ankyrin repeat protein
MSELEIYDTNSDSEEDNKFQGFRIDNGTKPSSRPDSLRARNSRALLHAAHDGDTAKVEAAWNRGADVNFKGLNRMTALHHTSYDGLNDTIQALFSSGVDVNAASTASSTPLRIAVARRLSSTVVLLLNHRASPPTPGGCFESTSHIACLIGQGRVIKLLLEAKSNLPGHRDICLQDCGVYLSHTFD